MKYTVATVVLSGFGVCVLGASELHEQRTGQTVAMLRGAVSAMSQRDLAIARRQCEPSSGNSTVTVAYCAEVQRLLDSQPLQVVIRPRPFVYF